MLTENQSHIKDAVKLRAATWSQSSQSNWREMLFGWADETLQHARFVLLEHESAFLTRIRVTTAELISAPFLQLLVGKS